MSLKQEIVEAFNILTQVRNISSTKSKQEILSIGVDNQVLKTLLILTYNPSVQYYAGNYVVDNVTIENVTYAINVNTTKEVSLEVKNSTLQGWTSYGTSTTASFVNVAFTKGTQATFRPYGTTILSNCSFEAGFTIDLAELGAGETIVFEGCTYGGAALTTDNLTGYTGKESFVTVR